MPTPDELYREHEKLKAEGKLEEAAARLNEALEQDPKFVDAHLGLAVVYWRLQQIEDSVRHGELACQLAPHDAFNFTALSVTYQRAWQATGDNLFIHKAEEAKARAHMLEGR